MRTFRASWFLLPALFLLAPLAANAAAQESGADLFAKYKEQLLNDPDAEGKGIAAHWLLNNQKPDSTEGMEFLRGILRDTSPSDATVARIRAVLKAFSLAGNYSAIEEMLLLVSDPREVVRDAAIKNFQAFQSVPDKAGRLSSEIIRAISSPLSPEKTRRAAIVAAGALRLFEAVEPLAALLANAKFSEPSRNALFEIVRVRFQDKASFDAWWGPRKGWTREQIIEEVLQGSSRENLDIKLKWMKGDFARHLEALRDANPEIRRAAAAGLSSFRTDPSSAKALDPLCQQFRVEYEGGVREEILTTLGNLGSPASPTVRDLLLGALDAESARERRAAVRSLASFASDPLVLPTLAGIVRQWVENQRNDEIEFRTELFQTLANASEPEGVPGDLGMWLGICLINDPTPEVRKYAALALGAHGSEKSIADLASSLSVHQEADQNVRFAAAIALKQIGVRIKDVGKVLVALHSFLADPAFQNRKQGIELLGELRDARSAEPLLRRLGGEPDPELRRSLFAAIGSIGEPSVLEALLKMDLRENDSRDAYFQTIEKICGKEPRRLLRAAQECFARGEPARSVTLLERALAADGLESALALEIRKQLVPSYRNAAREVASRPNAPAGAGADLLSKAKNALTELRRAEPDQLGWALAFAEVQTDLGQKEEAIASYQEMAPKLEKADAALLRRALDPLANLLLEKKDLGGAIAALSRIVAASPAERPPLEKLAQTRVQAGQIREAMKDYESLISITSREETEPWWRAVAGLCALRIEHSYAAGTWQYLRDLPAAGTVSPALAAQLASLRQEALEWIEFVGPLPPAPIPYEPQTPKKSE